MAHSRIAELASAVAQHTQLVDNYLAENNLPQPSFDADGPVDLGLPADIEQSRIAALQASKELNDLLLGPRELVFDLQHNILVSLQLISRFEIAKKVPVHGETTFAALAASTGVDHGALCTILRHGIAHRVFKEPRPGVIEHSAASRQLADDPRFASWLACAVDEMWPAAEKVVDALTKWPLAAEPNQTGFSLANQTDLSFYSVLEQNPERARRFGEAMSVFTTDERYSLRHLTDGYPWEKISSGTVVDLGGSHGDVAFALARKYPNLNLIVQELPQVVANAKEQEGLNVKFMVHDLFQEQPVHGADAYLYRWIFHNWPEKYCIQALRSLLPALKKGSRVVVMDFIMPPPGTLPYDVDRKLRSMDLTMLEIGNAKERDLGEWKVLFEKADSRFVFRGVKQPPGSSLSIIEATWDN